MLHMGSDRPQSRRELDSLSAGELRKLLTRINVSSVGCVEKKDFVALAARSLGLDSPASPAPMPAASTGLGGLAAALGVGLPPAAPGAVPSAAPPPPSMPPPPSVPPPPSGLPPAAMPPPPPGGGVAAAVADLERDLQRALLEGAGDRGGARQAERDRSPSLATECSACSSGSRSRSRSPASDVSVDGEAERRPADWGVEVVRLSADDAASLAMGMGGGRGKSKIARASGADVDFNHQELTLELRGSLAQRRRAKKYADLVTKQRLGPNYSSDEFEDGDLTVLSVPPEVVGYVQGHGGSVLRSIEEEWGSLMIFVDVDLSRHQRLAIFGGIRGRRGSELKVLSAVETKMPGYFNTVTTEVVNRDMLQDPTGTWGTDYMTFKDEGEISYALGKQGGTRRKLERSSGAIVQYVGMITLISGTKIERERAKEYMKWLFQQLEGPVFVDAWEGRDDITVVDIPTDCIGYITGNRRATLGALEEEWGTLMFFMGESERNSRRRGGTEKLAIFGPERPRRGSELKVMSGIETKSPGTFTKGVREKTSDVRGFDTDRLLFRDEEVSYALGKDGATRKKLELASGAILQYVGNIAFIAGDLKERRRCREFLQWLLQQRRGSVTIPDISKRDDTTEVHIPINCKGWVTGNRGSELRRMELASGTYMFMALDSKGDERLLIFGVDAGIKGQDGGRAHAERMVNEMIQEKQRDDTRRRARARSDSRRRPSPSRRGGRRYDSRSRSR
eukprot:TRINITY_DN2452_c1_g1_i1.p1 TRINITY_DN2452_c1_g1~~TRINITY_DN2452_c1_g1_i1.p1  ORF type:complete len:735 (-),score=183.67 TRINITY_DN2452_c1_g1_i1:147-2351(-)